MSLLAFTLTRQPTFTEQQPGGTTDPYGNAIANISGLVSWWRWNENAGSSIAVDAQGLQNGAYNGGISFNHASLIADTDDPDITLNGTDAYIEVAHNAGYNLANGTIAVWFQLDAVVNNSTILSKDITGLALGNFILWYLPATTVLRFQLETASANNFCDGTAFGALTVGTTYCAIIQWGAGGMKLYLAPAGGQLQLIGTNVYTGGISNANNLRIGATQFTGAPANFFDGVMGDVIIWNRALNDTEIQTVAQATLVTTPGTGEYEGIVAGLTPAIYLKLNEASGATVADSSGNGRSGTITGTPAGYNVTALVNTTGSGNGGLNLGASASISVPHAAADVALAAPSNWSAVQSTNGFRFIGDCTVGCWFKPNALPGAGVKAVIFAKAHTATPGLAASYAETTPILANRGGTVNGGSWEAYIDSAGAVHVEVRSFRGRLCRVRTPDGAVSAGTGYHLAVQLSYDGVTAWLNGAKFEDGYANALHVFGLCANIRGATFRNNYPWTIGAAPWGGQSNIQVDEFAVYLRAPSATITQANINSLSNNVGTPAVLAHHIWGRRTVNRSSYASIQAAIDDLANDTPVSGGTVLVNGGATAGSAATYNESITFKSNVRVKKNPANLGHAQINGEVRCPQPTVAFLTDDASNFMTGDRTLDITNTRAAGDIVNVVGTRGTPSPMRVGRRYIPNAADDNNPAGADGEWFEIESRTGSEMTFVGVGSTFDFATANREEIKAATPIRDIALEGDLRFSFNPGADSVIDLSYVNRARIIGARATNLNTTGTEFGGFAMRTLQGARSCQFRNVTLIQRSGGSGWGSNDGLSFYNGSIDNVGINVTVNEGRHAADVTPGGTWGPAQRCEFINITWVNNNSHSVGGAGAAFGIHGSTVDVIFWHCFSNWGGMSASGWKHDARWMVCGNASEASGNIGLGDGSGDGSYRDLHVIRPVGWFRTFEGLTDVRRCHFEALTRTANPTDTAVHELIYGTGANVNTYRNIDAALRHSSWVLV